MTRPVGPWGRSRLARAALWTWTLFGAVGLLIVGWLVFLRPAFLAQLPELALSLSQSGAQLDSLLSHLPSVQPGTPVSELARRGALALSGGVAAVLSAALSIGTGIVLVVVLWAVYLSGGPRLARTALGLVPSRHRGDARELGDRVWQTLGSNTRALTAVAVFDAVAVGVGLWFLGVPLALPLAVLVGLAEGGLGTAAAVLVLLIVVVQMVDGYIIQPLVMGKVVEVTAVTVIVSIALGAALLGVLGTFFAVPVAATIARTVAFVRERQEAETEVDVTPTGYTGRPAR